MKKIIMFLMVVTFCVSAISVLEAIDKKVSKNITVTWPTTPGTFTENTNPLEGQDRYTYREVHTDKTGPSDDRHYHTYCYDPGSNNCRGSWSGLVSPVDNNGNAIFTEAYMIKQEETMIKFAIDQIDKQIPEGKKHFDIEINGIKYYQTLVWYTTESTVELEMEFVALFD